MKDIAVAHNQAHSIGTADDKGYKGHTSATFCEQITDCIQVKAADQADCKGSKDHNSGKRFLTISHFCGENHNNDWMHEIDQSNEDILGFQGCGFHGFLTIGIQFILPAGQSKG